MDEGPGAARSKLPRYTAAWVGVGTVLALALAGWVAYAANGIEGARPGPVLGLTVGVALALAVGFLAGRVVPVVAVLGLAGVVLLVLLGSMLTLDRPDGDPLGYANANAHLAGLGLISALAGALMSWRSPRASGAAATLGARWLPRWWPTALRTSFVLVGLGLAILLADVVLVPTSKGAVAFLALVVALAVLAVRMERPRIMVVGGAVAAAVMLAGTVLVAVDVVPEQVRTLTAARGDLWAGAAELIGDEPVSGVGPGRFAALNPVTRDPDLRWVHHGYLQVGAELGVVGLVLVLAVFVWAFLGLWQLADRRRPAASAAVVGATALTYLALHATVDYLFHFPALVLTVAGLVGWSLGAVLSVDSDT